MKHDEVIQGPAEAVLIQTRQVLSITRIPHVVEWRYDSCQMMEGGDRHVLHVKV